MQEFFDRPKYLTKEGAKDIVNNPLELIIRVYPERYLGGDGNIGYGVSIIKTKKSSQEGCV